MRDEMRDDPRENPRENLIGYLIDAVDAEDARSVAAALADPTAGPALRRDLERLKSALRPLERDRESIAAPPGLADRTLQFVRQQKTAGPLPMPRAFPTEAPPHQEAGPRAWLDRLIMAATALAACILVARSCSMRSSTPAPGGPKGTSKRPPSHCRDTRNRTGCFPVRPTADHFPAGLYAPTLVSEQRLVADDGTLLCPDTELSRRGGFRVPTLDELKAAIGTPEFDEMVRTMGGDYGYTLGHRDSNGLLQPIRNQRREHHPIMADAPDDSGEKSSNHPSGIHHVLYEDGHVKRLSAEDVRRDDHLFKNHSGRTAAGIDSEDAVIGDSHHQP